MDRSFGSRTSDPPLGQAALLAGVQATLRYAFQPIVNIHTGGVYGFEALLRGVDELGFDHVDALFVRAAQLGLSAALDRHLRALAIARFARLPNAARYRLFFNMDPRHLADDRPEETWTLLARHGLSAEVFCVELSERADLAATPEMAGLVGEYRRHRFQLAIDDFGTGYAGLRLLYEHPPDLLKIDRFFVAGIADDHRKRLFVANTVQLAHVMGISVIAEGVETERELLACKEVGCDLVQGYLIARPQLEMAALLPVYGRIAEINDRDRRQTPGDRALIEASLQRIAPLHESEGVKAIFEAFRLDKGHHVVPVLDGADRPLGLILESDIKEFIYSIYGRDLILNRAYARKLLDFVRSCPVVDIHDSAERLVEAYSANVNPAGLLVTLDARYVGFISAMSLLQLIEQKNLAVAREQNPLTKLAGNNPIYEYVSRALEADGRTRYLAYLDFDNFKAFNDHYGFRRGDRAILMFAELLRKRLLTGGPWFVGHIGGDDFFAGVSGQPCAEVVDQLTGLLDKFRFDVQSLYDSEDRERGYIRARDRYGQERDMPLIRCSAALLELRPGHDCGGVETLMRTIAEVKHQAKADAFGLVLSRMPGAFAGAHSPGSAKAPQAPSDQRADRRAEQQRRRGGGRDQDVVVDDAELVALDDGGDDGGE
ncbi:EAL domain-containing protein [Thioflavicoccus mobilis 8321]|uniref:EAL domain-containing protein n=1 Tax=Thioflavicoccus mobilis 8321 TaxID=765912 RepID=L0GVP1_9GAMM|nr:EAL domain-containing protein [Thioflavicoccus mobilis 8321]